MRMSDKREKKDILTHRSGRVIDDMIISSSTLGLSRYFLVAGFSVWIGEHRSGSNTGQTILGLLVCCQTLQVYQTTYGLYFFGITHTFAR